METLSFVCFEIELCRSLVFLFTGARKNDFEGFIERHDRLSWNLWQFLILNCCISVSLDNVARLVYKKIVFSWANKTSKKHFTFNGYSTAINSISAEIIPTKKTICAWSCITCILSPISYLFSLSNDWQIKKTYVNTLHILPSTDILARCM